MSQEVFELPGRVFVAVDPARSDTEVWCEMKRDTQTGVFTILDMYENPGHKAGHNARPSV